MKQRITIDLPDEFIALCQADEVEPERVLKSFIADLSGIMNWASDLREDGYLSHGSGERMKAREYYDRVGYLYWKQYK